MELFCLPQDPVYSRHSKSYQKMGLNKIKEKSTRTYFVNLTNTKERKD